MLKHAFAISAAALFATGALAQEAMVDEPVAISAWNYDELYAMEGFRGEALLDADVYGVGGEEIGEVENVIFEGDQAIALVAESGGFLDIGDRHVVVPWDQVEFIDGAIVVPVTEETLDDYDIWGETSVVSRSLDEIKVADDGEVAPTVSAWRLTDLLYDYATAAGAGYGYINDVIMSRDGSIEAVVTMPRGGGYYATPFYGTGYGYSPYGSTYDVGYGAGELGGLEEFEYGELNDDWW